MKAESESEVLPVLPTSRYYMVHVKVKDLWLLALIQRDVSPLQVIEFLYRFADILVDYFDVVSESVIKSNFVTVYELLEEMIDNGIPFNTEPNQLRAMIPPPSFVGNVAHSLTGKSATSAVLPEGAMSSIPWRRTGASYTANEVYFDIIEEVDAIIDANGMMVSSEVNGRIMSSCHLSGMPDLSMVFRNSRILDDVSFHPCVRLGRWQQSRVLSFVPPDGNYKLMEYCVRSNVQLPLYVKPQISFHDGSGKVTILVGTKIGSDTSVENVRITIPWDKSVVSCTLTSAYGKVEFNELTKVLVWELGRLPAEKNPMLSGSVNLAPGVKTTSPNVEVGFKVSMFSSSGIKVDSLAVHQVNYKPYKGIRVITKGGRIEVRSGGNF
jgi:AP-3 complex subunit mu